MTQFKGDPKWYPACAVPLVVLCLLVAMVDGKAASLWEAHRYGARPELPGQNDPPSEKTTTAILPPTHTHQPVGLGYAKTHVKSDIELARDPMEHDERLPTITVTHSSSEVTPQGEPSAAPIPMKKYPSDPRRGKTPDDGGGELEQGQVSISTQESPSVSAMASLRRPPSTYWKGRIRGYHMRRRSGLEKSLETTSAKGTRKNECERARVGASSPRS